MSGALCERIDILLNGDMHDAAESLSLLVNHKLDRLPMPGEGYTLERWRALAAVSQFDLSLAKLYEGHTDALAILEEIDRDGIDIPSGCWCVWAAEAPDGRALIHSSDDGGVVLSGAKHWCSGAATANHALLTGWEVDGAGPQLVAIELGQPGISINSDKWKAVGMARCMSLEVAFDGAKGRRVGKPGEYLSRPGFWHGGAGIAACWYGGAVGVALALKKSLLASAHDTGGYKRVALGKVELTIEETAAILRQTARWIDDHPLFDASHVALTARLAAERCAKTVIEEVGKAMGAAPFCLDEKFAKAVADLPVFIRQSHADRDFAALGKRSLERELTAWTL